MLQCNISNRKTADAVRDNLSRSWDQVLVPLALLSPLTANNWYSLIFKAGLTLATERQSVRANRVGWLDCCRGIGKRIQMAAMHYSSQ